MIHKLISVEVRKYPTLRVVFSDGFSGDLDLTQDIQSKSMFSPLRDRAFFATVKLAENGWSLGWKLDQLGEELDLSADGIRTDIETARVRAAAERYRASHHAAE